jgi:hypothetical protein
MHSMGCRMTLPLTSFIWETKLPFATRAFANSHVPFGMQNDFTPEDEEHFRRKVRVTAFASGLKAADLRGSDPACASTAAVPEGDLHNWWPT